MTAAKIATAREALASGVARKTGQWTNPGDQVGSAAPGDLILSGGHVATVTRVVILPPLPGGDASAFYAGVERGPIKPEFYSVVIQTTAGTRYTGGASAYIGSDLRVHWERS